MGMGGGMLTIRVRNESSGQSRYDGFKKVDH